MTVVHIFSFLHSMTFDLISGLHMQTQTWHPPLRLCIHAKYYVKSGLTNVLKNANNPKNMHLFSIRIANSWWRPYLLSELSILKTNIFIQNHTLLLNMPLKCFGFNLYKQASVNIVIRSWQNYIYCIEMHCAVTLAGNEQTIHFIICKSLPKYVYSTV